MKDSSQPDQDLIAEACEWAATIAMNESTELERRRFATWLDKSPNHAAAYRETCAAFDHPMVAAAIAQTDHDISNLDDRASDQPSIPAPTSWLSRVRTMRTEVSIGALAATVLVVALSISLLQMTPTSPNPDKIFTAEHVTDGADIKEIALHDGSSATLGARSAITVAYTADERRVTLLEGDGYFAVASDPSRPFIVSAGDTIVKAIGTAFDVRVAIDSVRVDVIEGTVTVQSSNQPTIAITANAGERLIFNPEVGLTKRTTSADTGLAAWRNGQLEYFNEELNLIVADANRYYDGDIKIISDEIGTMKVTALFPSTSIEHIFELLAQQVPISVSRTEQGDILLSASDN